MKNSARENIKQNTKNLQGEIHGVDSEIAMLQDCIFNATTTQKMRSRSKTSTIENNAPNSVSKSARAGPSASQSR